MKKITDRPIILLIEPPFYRLFKDGYSLDRYPLSLGYLAGAIRKNTNWKVAAYNADFNPRIETFKVSYLTQEGYRNYLENLNNPSRPIWKEVERIITRVKPDIVGISAKSQNFASACIVAGIAKGINRKTKVIVGGPHPSMVGTDTLKCRDIDYAVIGEGEETIVELLNALKSRINVRKVKGIIFRNKKRIIVNPPREFIVDIDSLRFPHQDAQEILIDYEKYPKNAFKYIFAVRGCPNNCWFCGSRKIWDRRVRLRSTDNIIKEIKELQKFGLKSVHFDDDTFGVTPVNIENLSRAIMKEFPGLKWSCELHVRLISKKTISLMKKSGCTLIQVGIESGNNEILLKIRKYITINQALKACKIIKNEGIVLQAFFMVGFPWETEKTLRDTVSAMKKVNCDDLVYSIFTPYPGTEAFETCRDNGLVDDKFDISLYNHQSPENCFCLYISKDRFRKLVSEIERMTDRRNSINKIKRLFSPVTFSKVSELGLIPSFKKGIRILSGK